MDRFLSVHWYLLYLLGSLSASTTDYGQATGCRHRYQHQGRGNG